MYVNYIYAYSQPSWPFCFALSLQTLLQAPPLAPWSQLEITPLSD